MITIIAIKIIPMITIIAIKIIPMITIIAIKIMITIDSAVSWYLDARHSKRADFETEFRMKCSRPFWQSADKAVLLLSLTSLQIWSLIMIRFPEHSIVIRIRCVTMVSTALDCNTDMVCHYVLQSNWFYRWFGRSLQFCTLKGSCYF